MPHDHIGADANFSGGSTAYKRALIAVIAINAAMFAIEVSAGYLARSQALKADALDFAGDTATYIISLAVIGASTRVRTTVAICKGVSLATFAVFVIVTTLMRILNGAAPDAGAMGAIGALALLANVASVLILVRWREGDANVRSVWLCSRNDAIGNVAVMAAGAAVWATGSAWPDLVVAAALAGLFLRSAWLIIAQADKERRMTVSRHA